MLDRIKKAWALGNLKESELNALAEKHGIELELPIGDGKAEFLGEGTEEEFKEQQDGDKGFKNMFGIGK